MIFGGSKERKFPRSMTGFLCSITFSPSSWSLFCDIKKTESLILPKMIPKYDATVRTTRTIARAVKVKEFDENVRSYAMIFVFGANLF